MSLAVAEGFNLSGHEKDDKLTSAIARAEKGVSGAGFITAVQPAARAGPSLRVIIAEGKFHGVMIDLNNHFNFCFAP